MSSGEIITNRIERLIDERRESFVYHFQSQQVMNKKIFDVLKSKDMKKFDFEYEGQRFMVSINMNHDGWVNFNRSSDNYYIAQDSKIGMQLLKYLSE